MKIPNQTNLNTKNKTLLDLVFYRIRQESRKCMSVYVYDMMYRLLSHNERNKYMYGDLFKNVSFYIRELGTVTSIVRNKEPRYTKLTIEGCKLPRYKKVNGRRVKIKQTASDEPVTYAFNQIPLRQQIKVIKHMFRIWRKKHDAVVYDYRILKDDLKHNKQYIKSFKYRYEHNEEYPLLLMWILWQNGVQDNTDMLQDKERVLAMLKYMGEFKGLNERMAVLDSTLNAVTPDGKLTVTDCTGAQQTLDFFGLNLIQRRRVMDFITRKFMRKHKWFFYHNVDTMNIYGILNLIEHLNEDDVHEEKVTKTFTKSMIKTIKESTDVLCSMVDKISTIMKQSAMARAAIYRLLRIIEDKK